METGSENTSHNKRKGLVVIGEINIDIPLTSPGLSEDKSSVVGIQDGEIVIYKAREDGTGKEWVKTETQGFESVAVESFDLRAQSRLL